MSIAICTDEKFYMFIVLLPPTASSLSIMDHTSALAVEQILIVSQEKV